MRERCAHLGAHCSALPQCIGYANDCRRQRRIAPAGTIAACRLPRDVLRSFGSLPPVCGRNTALKRRIRRGARWACGRASWRRSKTIGANGKLWRTGRRRLPTVHRLSQTGLNCTRTGHDRRRNGRGATRIGIERSRTGSSRPRRFAAPADGPRRRRHDLTRSCPAADGHERDTVLLERIRAAPCASRTELGRCGSVPCQLDALVYGCRSRLDASETFAHGE